METLSLLKKLTKKDIIRYYQEVKANERITNLNLEGSKNFRDSRDTRDTNRSKAKQQFRTELWFEIERLQKVVDDMTQVANSKLREQMVHWDNANPEPKNYMWEDSQHEVHDELIAKLGLEDQEVEDSDSRSEEFLEFVHDAVESEYVERLYAVCDWCEDEAEYQDINDSHIKVCSDCFVKYADDHGISNDLESDFDGNVNATETITAVEQLATLLQEYIK